MTTSPPPPKPLPPSARDVLRYLKRGPRNHEDWMADTGTRSNRFTIGLSWLTTYKLAQAINAPDWSWVGWCLTDAGRAALREMEDEG